MSAAVTEQPTDLLFWFGNGACGLYRARVPAGTRLSVGRTDSERAIGFRVMKGETHVVDFVLNRDQVDELATYLQGSLGRLRKPLGRKPHQISLVAMARATQARKQPTKRRKRA
jgi:hypothetical protein